MMCWLQWCKNDGSWLTVSCLPHLNLETLHRKGPLVLNRRKRKSPATSCWVPLHTPIQISRQWKSGRCNKHDNSSIGLDYRQHRGGCLLKHPWGTWAPPALSFLLWGPPTSCGEAAFRNSSGWSVFLHWGWVYFCAWWCVFKWQGRVVSCLPD